MPRVVLDISISLDGYVAGAGDAVGNGLGDGGERVHDWVFAKRTAADAEVLERSWARTGAVVAGRRLFEIVDAPGGWSDEVGFGAYLAEGEEHPPVVVVAGAEPTHVRLADRFSFVTTGVADAVATAQRLAGERDVTVMGGAATIRSCLAEGIGDELTLHVAAVLLGEGRALFPRGSSVRRELTPSMVVATPAATHLTYTLT